MKKLNALDILCSFSLTTFSLASLQRSYNVGRMAHKLSFNGKSIPSDPPTTVSNTGLETYPTGDSTSLVIHVAISQFVGTLNTYHLAGEAGIQR